MGAGQFALLVGFGMVITAYGSVAWLQSISPGPAPMAIWSATSELLELDIAPLSGSIANSPLQFFGRPLLAILVLTGGMLFGADSRRADFLLRTVIFSACVLGLIGLVAMLMSVEEIRPFVQGNALTAFFINKNTTATYLGSAFLAALALLCSRATKRLREGRPFFRANRDAKGDFSLVFSALVLVLLLPLTLSRAGVALTALLAVGAVGSKLPLRGRTLGAAAVACVILLAFVFAFSGEAWHLRQTRLNVDADARWSAYGLIWRAILERPLMGYGLGSFASSFPQFRDETLEVGESFNIGHSTPLELAFEGGLPLAFFVVAFSALLAVVLLRAVIRRPGDPYVLAALLVGLLGALHSSVDFSLQVPGYLIVCLAIVGIGLGRAFLPKAEVVGQPVRRRRRRHHDESASGDVPLGSISAQMFATTCDASTRSTDSQWRSD